MKRLWSYIDKKNMTASAKFGIAALLLSISFALGGFIIWCIISIWALSGLDWMICFILYPAVISWFLTYIYYCNHSFHDNSFQK